MIILVVPTIILPLRLVKLGTMAIHQETIEFLSNLENNNNRNWFAEHKSSYLLAKENWEQLFVQLQEQLNQFDSIENYKIFRIYRDVRFSKNKVPYKTNLSGYFSRSGLERRGSYYIHLAADGSFQVGGGFYAPNKEDLFRIRKEIEMDGSELEELINEKQFKSVLGNLQGERLKTAPRGFPKDHKYIDLIRLKNFYFMQTLTKKEVLSDTFTDKVIENFRAIRPFFDYMSSVLTTNLNGESIL